VREEREERRERRDRGERERERSQGTGRSSWVPTGTETGPGTGPGLLTPKLMSEESFAPLMGEVTFAGIYRRGSQKGDHRGVE
jgi:hypothetical protein